jgi:hypothetical protein
MGRFEQLTVGELQQLVAAVVAAEAIELFPPGEGNLLPGLREELGHDLDEKIGRRES